MMELSLTKSDAAYDRNPLSPGGLRRRRRVWILAATLPLLLPLTLAGAQQTDDEFFDTDFDGGWVGTILSGKSRIPFQLNLNVEGNDGLGFLIVGNQPDGSSTALTVFAVDFTKITNRQVTFRIDDNDALRFGLSPRGFRFGTWTLKLAYKPADDSLGGKISGGIKGKITATRMSPDRPVQRLWQGSFKSGGETTFVQFATTEDADGVIGGHARCGAETATVTGQRNGNTVNMAFDLNGQEISFSGKLKTKKNKMKGAFESEGASNKATLVPADGNGKPMKFTAVEKLATVEVIAGQSSTVSIRGKNIALGALIYTDSSQVRITAVTLKSSKQLSVKLTPNADIAEGTNVALRLFNGDGETADKASALTVADGDDGEDSVNFELQIQPIFTNSCALAGCHASPGAKAGLNLDAASSIANLVNVPSSQQPGLQRVLPGNPDDSYLVRKLEGGPGITGARMPLSRASLPTAQLDLIRLWIAQGASARHVQQ